MKSCLGSWLIIILMVVFFSCDSGVSPEDLEKIDPKFTALQSNVFDLGCSTKSCHGSDGAGNLFLTKDKSYTAMVNIRSSLDSKYYIVRPGNADSSYLYLKLTNPPSGALMPKGNPKLSDAKIAAVKEWINNGALNN